MKGDEVTTLPKDNRQLNQLSTVLLSNLNQKLTDPSQKNANSRKSLITEQRGVSDFFLAKEMKFDVKYD